MAKRASKVPEALRDKSVFGRTVTRKEFVAGGAATAFGLLLAACSGGDEEAAAPEELPEPAPTKPPLGDEAPLKQGLAEGMYGGPTGFEGAERYQYPLDSEEGRAISALRRLRQDGKAPESIVVQVGFGRSQFEVPFPEGAPSVRQLFEEETGIKIDFLNVTGAEMYRFNLQNAASRNASFDIVNYFIEEVGDHAESGLLRPLDDLVERHRPSWLDPVFGYAGGKPFVKLLNTYKGQTYTVAFDMDAQAWAYRADLLEDPGERAAFAERYGRELRVPLTWDEQAEVAEFFTRPDADPPLYGSVEYKAEFWGPVNWQQRFVSSGNPNFFYFNEDGSANVNNEAGIRATEEHGRSLQWSDPTALVPDPGGARTPVLLGSGSGFMAGVFANITKFFRVVPGLSEAFPFSQLLKTEIPPGRIVDGGLVRRSVVDLNPSFGVNAFTTEARQEAAYLFLQWAGGARVHTWTTANIPGFDFLEPHHTYSLEDPLVAAGYGEGPLETVGEVIPRTAPELQLRGALRYFGALDEELQRHLLGEQRAEQAMKNVEDRWNGITEELGVESQVEAIKSLREAYPATVDEPPL